MDGGADAFGPFVPLGQHLIWVAPTQNPVLTTAPLQSNLVVSMHVPGLLYRQFLSPEDGGDGGGGGVAGDGAFASFCPDGQHLTLVAPRQ